MSFRISDQPVLDHRQPVPERLEPPQKADPPRSAELRKTAGFRRVEKFGEVVVELVRATSSWERSVRSPADASPSCMLPFYSNECSIASRVLRIIRKVGHVREHAPASPGRIEGGAEPPQRGWTDDVGDPAAFVFEEYLDEAGFEAHIGAEYGAVFNRQLSSLIEEGASQLTFLTRFDPA